MATRRMRAGRGGIAVAAAAAVLLLLAGGAMSLLRSGAPVIGGPFTLIRGDGQVVTDRTLRGRYVLIYFGYTNCPDICPAALASLADAMDALGPKAAELQPVFITIDPARDTPAIAARYAASFTPLLLGLSGTAAEIDHVARQYHVARLAADPAGHIDHSAVLYLVGPDGRYLAPIRATATGAAMARTLAAFLA